MKDVIQVVDNVPTAKGEWASFWHVGAGIGFSAEFANNNQGFRFEIGDIFLCRAISDDEVDLIGPLPFDVLNATEFWELPVFVDQGFLARHNRPSRFFVDRHKAMIAEKRLSDMLPAAMSADTVEQNLRDIARLRELN